MLKTMTVANLKAELANWPDDYTVYFSGLSFHRLKKRGEKVVQMEFSEVFSVREKRQGRFRGEYESGTPTPTRL